MIDNTLTDSARVEMACNFLDTLYGAITETRYTYLWTLNKVTQAKETLPFDISKPDERAKMAETAIKENNKGLMVYFGVHLSSRPIVDKHKRAVAADITAQIAVIADIDIESAWHISDGKKKYPPNVETAAALLPFKPSILVNSGGGIHAYNLLDTPLEFDFDRARDDAKRRNEDYINCIRQRAGEYSKVIDGVGDLPRVLQMVGCYNVKHGMENAPLVSVIEYDKTFTHSDFTNKLRIALSETPKESLINPAQNSEKSSNNTSNDAQFDSTDDPPEYQQDLISALLDAIDPSTLSYNDWFSVITSCVNLGVAEGVINSWSSRGGKKYNPEADSKKIHQTNNAGIDIENLIGKAQAAGFSVKDFKRQWYKQHTEYKQRTFEYTENKLATAEKAFEDEKQAAIEYIKNLETFDTATVTSSETLRAAAFAKIFDFQTYSKNFYDEIAKLKVKPVNLNDLKAALKPFVEEITARDEKLKRRRMTFDADKKSAAFIEKNDFMSKFKTPYGYEVSDDGIFKLVEDQKGKMQEVKICRLPLILAEKFYNIDCKTYTAKLAYKSNGNVFYSPAVDLETICNFKKLTALSNHDVPVTSENSYKLVKFFDDFRAENENAIPVTCTVKNCGWRKVNGEEKFIDPRRKLTITGSSGTSHNLIVEDSAFSQNLKAVGSLKEWRRVYDLAKKYPIARFLVAAALTPPLLKILDERNFAVYVYGTTRAGKSSALLLATSAVGSPKMIRTFDATKNGLLGAAADASDYVFAVDEKQAATKTLLEQLANFVYSYCEGIERGRAGRDGKAKILREWRGVLLMTGETQLLFEGVTGGAYTRALQLKLKKSVLPKSICEDTSVVLPENICIDIRRTIKENYGHALPLVIAEIERRNFKELREMYYEIITAIQTEKKDLPPEYIRYVSRVTLADFLLNVALNKDDGNFDEGGILQDSLTHAAQILKFVPAAADISDAARVKDIIEECIFQYQSHFLGVVDKPLTPFLGKKEPKEKRLYITIGGLKFLCEKGGLSDCDFAISHLKSSGYLQPEKACQKRIGILKNRRCYWIELAGDDSSEGED